MSKAYVEVPGKVCLTMLVGSSLGLLSSNPWLTVASIALLPFFIFSVWRKGEPPVLSFILFFQWLEVTLKVFNSDLAGIPVEGMVKLGEGVNATYFYSQEAARAIGLSLGCLASLAVGMRLGLSRIRKGRERELQAETSTFSIEKLFSFYLGAFILYAMSNRFVWHFPSVSQPLLAFMGIKWAILFLLAYTVLQRRSRYIYLLLAFFLEITVGFLAYFAQFKGVIFIVALAFLTLHYRLHAKHILTALSILVIALYFGAVWSVVKMEYRTFLDEASQRGDALSLENKIGKMSGLVKDLNGEKIRAGLTGLSERIAYVDFFARVLQLVPNHIPYEEGRIWKKALIHVLTPRLFFPDKPYLASDSEITRKYTEIQVAGSERGTSIGIGHFAESYVDFGPKFMFIPIFLLGILEGWIYRYFISKSKTKIVGGALTVAALLFSGGSIANNSTKLLGGVLANFIVLAVVLKLFERPFIKKASSRSLIRIPAR